MATPNPDRWLIQEARRRFREVIRAAMREGPQFITRHGEDIAVIVDITEYRRLTGSGQGLAQILLGGPRLGDDEIAVLNEIEAERRADLDLRSR
jgi:prevent-host-death family protein